MGPPPLPLPPLPPPPAPPRSRSGCSSPVGRPAGQLCKEEQDSDSATIVTDPVDPSLICLLVSDQDPYILNYGSGSIYSELRIRIYIFWIADPDSALGILTIYKRFKEN